MDLSLPEGRTALSFLPIWHKVYKQHQKAGLIQPAQPLPMSRQGTQSSTGESADYLANYILLSPNEMSFQDVALVNWQEQGNKNQGNC